MSGAGGDARGKIVMALARNSIKMIRIGEQARMYKEIPLPNTLTAARRGTIACVGTEDDYCLLDTENMARISLSPISTAPESPDPSSDTSHPGTSPSSPVPRPHDVPVSDPVVLDNSADPSTHTLHPPRNSSLNHRERRHSSATGPRESSGGHSRSSSAGGTNRHLGPSPRPASSLLSPLNPGSPRSRSTSPIYPAKSNTRGKLRPHIASPIPSEFLLTTGTRPEDPGIGMFVNMNGDVTRGTISFDRYPDQLLVDGGWIIATIPGIGLEIQRWDLDDASVVTEKWERSGRIFMNESFGIKEVVGLDGSVVGDVARILQFVPVQLTEGEELKLGGQRENEERAIAQRIATVDSRLVVFQGTQAWSLLRCPLVLRLDATLPDLADSRYDGIESRIMRTLDVLRKVDKIEPDTERAFHEVTYIRQKSGLLVLGEILQITSAAMMKRIIKPDEVIRAENALVEGSVDPRLVVALFGPGFGSDIVLGAGGVWVYEGIKDVFTSLKTNTHSGSPTFTRDAFSLLKRYLMAWRKKKGFGSVAVADEKEVFRTIDTALLRALLILDSPQYLTEKGQTVVPEGNVRAELYSFVDSEGVFDTEDFKRAVSVLKEFGRLYVLSILYQRRKMYRDVLNTWKRILEESQDTSIGNAQEFSDGEDRIRAYLLKMKDPKLVEEFGKWLAARNPRLGISVFTDPKAKVKFEPPRIMEILKQAAPGAVRAYIEFLVVEKKDATYGNELIMLYLDDLIDVLTTNSDATERLKNSYESYRALDNPKPTYRQFINDNLPATVPDANSSLDAWWYNRMRLLELLSSRIEYVVPEVVTKVSQFREALVPEMVILYGRERRHEDAIRLLTHGLKDFDTAIDYCLFGGLSIFDTRDIITDRDEQKALLGILLKEFLGLHDLNERIQQTSNLLERFGSWLDVLQVLELVPDSWSIDIVSKFLISALRRLVREKAEVEVVRGLMQSQNLRVESKFVEKCDELGPMIDRGN